MELAAGRRLGPYEILAVIGSGGVGSVYKARDTRLDRSVAIKVLHPRFALNAGWRQRFEREARAISQLNHPNICTLYDVGTVPNEQPSEGEDAEATEYLVLEYLEGETLAQRLANGPLSLDQALRYGVEIAEALADAHRAGIVHGDLKPSNVMLTKAGAKPARLRSRALHACERALRGRRASPGPTRGCCPGDG